MRDLTDSQRAAIAVMQEHHGDDYRGMSERDWLKLPQTQHIALAIAVRELRAVIAKALTVYVRWITRLLGEPRATLREVDTGVWLYALATLLAFVSLGLFLNAVR